MSRYKKIAPPEVAKAQEQEEKTKTITREYELITPLFGGGAEPTEYDPVTIIRASEIRGHLRFWWRACRGAKYKTLKELKAAEDALWGKAHKKGDKYTLKYKQVIQVMVEISGEHKGTPKEPFKILDEKDEKGNWKVDFKGGDIRMYAAFPLQPTKEERKQKEKPIVRKVYTDIRFTLVITCLPDHEEAVQDALWAWETFGGIGARIRRGFGAIGHSNPALANLPATASTSDVTNWLSDQLKKHVTRGRPPEGVPYLSEDLIQEENIRVLEKGGSPGSAWKQLIEKLAEFRQSPVGRSGRGESHWPEADAIRNLMHLPLRRDKSPRPKKFPRAAFGLPIEFHLPHEIPDRLSPMLQGADEKNDRLASPIILRPLVCRDKQAVGLALLLSGHALPKAGVVLKEKDERLQNGRKKKGKAHKVDVQLTDDDLYHLQDLIISQPDVLRAFMDYLGGK